MEIFRIFGVQMDTFMSGTEFMQLQGQSNTQAVQSAQGGAIQKPNNAYKNKEPELTLGNKTVL